MRIQERGVQARGTLAKQGMLLRSFDSGLLPVSGEVICDLKDLDGNQLAYFSKSNIITLDAGILGAWLFRGAFGGGAARNPLLMLGVGTGAIGNQNDPDPPQATRRRLRSMLARKPFSSVQFRDALGNVSAIPTHVVDFTVTFVEGEAVGPLNEMGLISTINNSVLPAFWLEVPEGTYDASLDVSGYDLLANYLCFGTVNKPALSILSFTWRLTF